MNWSKAVPVVASRPRTPVQNGQEPAKSRNVLVVDDSAVARLIVQRVINETSNFKVVGHAGSAEEALEKLKTLSVDLVILDIEMPGMDGIAAIPHIIRGSRNAPILIVSSHCHGGAKSSVRAMAMGASDLILKPDSPALNEQFAAALLEKMERLTEQVTSQERVSQPQSKATDYTGTGIAVRRPVKCLAIGASTGGIHALSTFFSELPREIKMPILVTQHLPADFIVYFARQLHKASGRKTIPARDGQHVEGGEILISSGDAHLTVTRSDGDVRVCFDYERTHNGFCPSVDPMLSSVAEVYGSGAVGIVLTGMGRDGVAGAEVLAKAGGEILTQDRESSVIWGMPGAVARRGIANVIAPPIDLANHVAHRARTFGCK